MENQNSISTISDEVYDNVLVYKLFSNPALLESLKQIENIEVFKSLEKFYVSDLKVWKYFLLIKTWCAK